MHIFFFPKEIIWFKKCIVNEIAPLHTWYNYVVDKPVGFPYRTLQNLWEMLANVAGMFPASWEDLM